MLLARKFGASLIAAIAAAFTGFIIHVSTQAWVQAWVQSWVAERMQGHAVTPSWEVRYIALATSLEVGIGLVILYALVHRAMPVKSPILRGLVLGIILLAVMGRLVRQPLMNLVIGNPLTVVLVQDGISWLVWLSSAVVVAVVYERFMPKDAAQ